MKPRVLMIYDRFPPFNVSGSARVFSFAKHLPELGYHPIVLASETEPDDPRDERVLAELPRDVDVLRAAPWLAPRKNRLARWLNRHRATRSAQHLNGSIQRTPKLPSRRVFRPQSLAWRVTGLPMWALEWHLDWAPPAILRALRDRRVRSVDLVWVSAPHVRNLFVGEVLSRLLRKPLVVDLRDPWTYGSLWLPRGRLVAACETARAHRILTHAARVVVTSPLTQTEMERRFPTASFITITNGFSTGSMPPPLRNFPADKCLFRYVGLLNERRTPNSLLKGLAIACQNPALKARVGLEFVGPMAGHEHLIEQLGLQEVVTSRGLVSQQDSLRLMRGSDVNVVLQTIREGQDVIAGKTFEYLAAGKPILAAVAEQGGDAWLLRQVGGAEIVPYDEPEKIARAIERCFERFLHTPVPAPASKLAAFERKELARQLARLFDEVLAEPR